MKRYMAIFILLFSSCEEESATTADSGVSATFCKGIYYSRDSNGDLQKYNEFLQKDQKKCLTDKIGLTKFEASTERRRKQNVKCKPQPEFNSKALRANGNYYSYRDNRYFIDFDSTTGEFRRLTIGSDKNGNTVFQRDLSCYYVRTDLEVEPVRSFDYETQLMLDFSESPISSASFVPVEIFKIGTNGSGDWSFERYDETFSWSFSFCPQNTVPYDFCKSLRNGNLYFDPTVSATVQTALLNEAKLIRTSFLFAEFSRTDFDSLWNYHSANTKEVEQGGDWVFYVNHVVDAPKLFDHSWRAYLRREAVTMPDVDYSSGLTIPICFKSSKSITYANNSGSGRIYGETCTDGHGGYVFTAY